MRRRRARLRSGEGGFTAAELVVGVAVLFLLTAGALGFLESASRTVRVTTKETESLDLARVTLARMAAEVRSALAVHTASISCPLSTCLIITVKEGAATTEVRYRYDGATAALLRAEGDILTGIWGSEAPVATSIRNGQTPVFTRNVGNTIGTEAAIKVVLDVNVEPSRPSQVIRLDSTLTPRNL